MSAITASATVHERLRADLCIARAWAYLNGSSADARAASDPDTNRCAGDPDCTRGFFPWSRETRERLTRERLTVLTR